MSLMNTTHIKQFREKYGITQEQLAELLSVSRRTIVRAENSVIIPSVLLPGFLRLRTRHRLKALKREIDEILTEVDNG